MAKKNRTPIERKALGANRLHLRQVDEDSPTQIVGYAAVFDSEAYGEVIRRGAFTKTLDESDVRAYWSHDPAMPLGRMSNDTLALREDDTGLWAEITPNPDTEWGRSALASVERGDVNGMSFGFRTIQANYIGAENEDEDPLRELLEVRLYEVSPVAEPWYEATTAESRDEDKESDGGTAADESPLPGQAAHSTDEAQDETLETETIEAQARKAKRVRHARLQCKAIR